MLTQDPHPLCGAAKAVSDPLALIPGSDHRYPSYRVSSTTARARDPHLRGPVRGSVFIRHFSVSSLGSDATTTLFKGVTGRLGGNPAHFRLPSLYTTVEAN